MSQGTHCPRCGGAVVPGEPCPRCLLRLALGDATALDLSRDSEARDGVLSASSQIIDRYTLLRVFGEGGMGVVYEAEQDHPRRIVALKVIRPGLDAPDLLRRFEQEAAGARPLCSIPASRRSTRPARSDTGFGPQPFFAMEFIRGERSTNMPSEHRLSVRQRLELIAKSATPYSTRTSAASSTAT